MQATVVSLLPYPILSEHKPGLFPAHYNIPAAPEGEMGVLVVNDGQRGVYLDQERGSELMIVSGEVIAKSLVEDYVLSQPGQDQTAGPGLFWVKGVHTAKEIAEKFSKKVSTAVETQKDWWKRLVRLADDTWQHSHIIAQIGDLDRTACRQLGLKRDWLDDSPDAITKCPVCTTLISRLAMKCFACQSVVDPVRFKEYMDSVEKIVHPVAVSK